MVIDAPIEVINKLGLHARACGKLIEVTNTYHSNIKLGRGEHLVDAKNIISLMMLGASKGSVLRLVIDGEDAQAAHQAICDLFTARFYESE